ncbi:MAG TPA: septum formation initiator family protein [Thermoleophilaceae bacterium]|nr:septum formation initiator family protein [Thermoleophilaceae bacterium]
MAEARAATRPVSARRRVAPARGPGGIRWDRVARLALVVTLGAIVLLYIPPAAHWLSQSREAAREHGRLRQLTREHRQLERRIGELRTPGALEAEARRLGMVRRGERGYVIQNRLP